MLTTSSSLTSKSRLLCDSKQGTCTTIKPTIPSIQGVGMSEGAAVGDGVGSKLGEVVGPDAKQQQKIILKNIPDYEERVYRLGKKAISHRKPYK